MDLDQYQKLAMRTAPRGDDILPAAVLSAIKLLEVNEMFGTAQDLREIFDRLIHCLGLAGEVGELLEKLKKLYGHGHAIPREQISKEFGDIRWYQAVLEKELGFSSSQIAEENIEKLRKRYPDGFSAEASKARVDALDLNNPTTGGYDGSDPRDL